MCCDTCLFLFGRKLISYFLRCAKVNVFESHQPTTWRKNLCRMCTHLPLTQRSRTLLEKLIVHTPVNKFLALLKTRRFITCLYTHLCNLSQSRARLVYTLQAYVFKRYLYVIQYPWASEWVNRTQFQYLPLLLRSLRRTAWGRSKTIF